VSYPRASFLVGILCRPSSDVRTPHCNTSQAIETPHYRDESIVVKPGNRSIRCASASGLFLAALTLSSPAASAQAVSDGTAASGSALAATVTLPSEPAELQQSVAAKQSSANFSSSADSDASSATGGSIYAPIESLPEASPTEKYIEPGQAVPPLSAKYKVQLGVRAAFTPFAPVDWLAAASYEQWRNDNPNYGTDRGAFGQRLGAAVIRDVAEDVFADSFMSPLLREDPRYYRLGPAHNLFIRFFYAGFRPIVGRTDGGHKSPDFSNLTGTMAGAALTSAYYPPVNRSLTQTMETFGWSLGGSSVGYIFREFYSDITQMFHPTRRP
jgi:hypothetical protein